MKSPKSFRWERAWHAGAALALTVSTLWAADVVGPAQPNRLQALIDQAPAEGQVLLPAGTWTEPVVINKPLTLRGASPEVSIIEVTSDQPALRINSRAMVVLTSLTIRWQRATSQRPTNPAVGVFLKDTSLTLRSVHFQASGTPVRCPAAVQALGFSDLRIEQCRFEGFDFTVEFGGGAKGMITESVIWKPGHAGITVGPDSSVEVSRCVVAGSGFHGIRCTGGQLKATDNLVIGNKNRGFYLGNKSARGLIRNNVVHGNATGISGFAESEVDVLNNLISKSDYAALDIRDTCRLRVQGNIFLDNERALKLFRESGNNKNLIQTNLTWGNRIDAESFDPAPELWRAQPRFKDAAQGDFTPTEPGALQGHGLQDPAGIKALWAKWSALNQPAK